MTTTVVDLVTGLDAVVERGAALLDERGPTGWRELIDVDALEQRSTTTCVVGQVFAQPSHVGDDSWLDGLRRLDAPTAHTGGLRPWLAEHGFDIDYYGVLDLNLAFDQLTYAWRRYLTRKK